MSVNTAVIPASKLENDFYDWWKRHEERCSTAASGRYDVVFIGDSITHLFEWEPASGRGFAVWRSEIAPLNALNLGFGWDRTQNVLWRLQNGQLAGQSPKVVVLLIGTNNLTGTENARTNTPQEICHGVAAICDYIQSLSPQTALLILGLLPRSTPQDPLRTRVIEVNQLLAGLENPVAKRFYLNFGARYLRSDGTIPVELMDDLVHPTAAGYQIFADAVLPEIKRLLQT